MTHVLRWTGVGKLVSFYRYFAFDAPWTTTGAGVLLLGGIAATRLYLVYAVVERPLYLVAYLAVTATAAVVAAGCMLVAASRAVTVAGWVLGSLVSAAFLAVYLVSRSAGLPGLPQLVGHWGYALGTLSMLLAAGFLGLHLSVITGMNVAVPQRRQWHS